MTGLLTLSPKMCHPCFIPPFVLQTFMCETRNVSMQWPPCISRYNSKYTRCHCDWWEVFLWEVGCTFDSSLEEAFLTKQVKYQPLVQAIIHLGYKCQLIVFIFGSLGHVHRLVVRGLRIMRLSKCKAKQLVTYCSISSIIGSRAIWRRRCFLYP